MIAATRRSAGSGRRGEHGRKHMRLARNAAFAAISLTAIGAALPAAAQQSVEQFYKGKVLTIEIGHPPGGSYDFYARLASAHMSKYIPGNPTIIVQSKPGGGGLLAVASFYRDAPRDGSMLGLFPETIADTQIFEPTVGKWNVKEFSYVGSFANVNPVFVERKGAPAKTVEEMRTISMNVGCSGRTGQSYQGPAALKAFAGMKFKLICGYPGSAEYVLALTKGEVDMVSSAWNQWKVEHPQELSDGTFVPMIQNGLTRHKDLPNLPLMQDLVQDPKLKQVFELVSAGAAIGRALMMPPGVPKDRLDAMRAAFDKMVADPVTIKDAASKNLELDPTPGIAVQKISDAIIDAPPDVIQMAAEAMK
jgi:tripartite-type tricarboxylate transporter receptor subunit TctC